MRLRLGHAAEVRVVQVYLDLAHLPLLKPQARPPVPRELTPQVSVRRHQRSPGEALPSRAALQLAHLLEGIDPDLGVASQRDPDPRAR